MSRLWVECVTFKYLKNCNLANFFFGESIDLFSSPPPPSSQKGTKVLIVKITTMFFEN